MCHFICTYYYLFNIKYISLDKIFSLFSEIWKFKDYQLKSQVASTEIDYFKYSLQLIKR